MQLSRDSYVAHSEPEVAENPRNALQLVAGSKFFTDRERYKFKIGTFYTADGGKTWTDGGLLPGLSRYYRVSDVSFAWAPKGTIVYVCVLATNKPRSGIFVLRSRDGGRTWSQPVAVFLDTSGQTFSDKPWIAVDESSGPRRGTVYVAWNLDWGWTKRRPNRPLGTAVARSTNHGERFSAPVIVYPFDKQHFSIGATPAVDPNGNLHVAYLTMTGAAKHERDSLGLTTSADGGVSFSPSVNVVPSIHALSNHLPHGNFRNLSLPAFAISPVTGTMVLAWADTRNGDADILWIASRDGVRPWSAPKRVNHDRVHNGKDQFQPALAVSADGAFTCSWFDRRYDPRDRLIDVTASQSRDDGRTFGTNVRVTAHSWDPAIKAPEPEGKPTNRFIGDYQGIAADDETVHPVWNDTQNGRSQEIRSADIPAPILAR